ncbi:hypothetical protein [Isoptericola hypogeus]
MAAAAALALTAALAPLPALAREPVATDDFLPRSASCPLERVGKHFVRCDNLTGDGQPAPHWIPVQGEEPARSDDRP